jgi:hypothetical protein
MPHVPPLRASARAVTLAAAVVLGVGMGFGRFSFTGMYPLMVRDGVLTVSVGSLAASANYAGYLIGALLLSRAPHAMSAALCRIALLGTALCILPLGFALDEWALVMLRFLAGVLSALAMVAGSNWLFHVKRLPERAPMLFAGVGVGIVASAELIAVGDTLGLPSRTLWIMLALACAVLALFTWSAFSRAGEPPASQASAETGSRSVPMPHDVVRTPGNDNGDVGALSLTIMYGLAGFGYIVTATYLPLIVHGALAAVGPIQVWAAFGGGAIASCFLWHAANLRLGARRALVLNLLVQAIGVILPALDRHPLTALTSAVLVGGTFTGTVTITMHAARKISARVHYNIAAVIVAAYGAGQVVGPLVSQHLFARSHSFDTSLWIAAAALLVACLPLCLSGRASCPRRAGQPGHSVKP